MDFNELKELVINKLKDYPEYKDRAIKELRRAKWLIENDNINIADELLNSDKEIDDRYVLPFFLGKTTKVDLSKPLEIIQVREGGGSGLDIDTDFEPKAKEAVKQMLIEKYGRSKVMGIGTYTTVGLASGIKDILRKCDVPFKESNDFCKELNNEISFEENMEYYKNNFPDLYKTYDRYQAYLDFTPKIMNGVKNCIPGNQLVNIFSGKKEIKDISDGDKIAYLNLNGETCYTDNFKKVWSGKKEVFEIELENGKKIRATEEHLFFTNHGLKKLKDLTEDDELYSIS